MKSILALSSFLFLLFCGVSCTSPVSKTDTLGGYETENLLGRVKKDEVVLSLYNKPVSDLIHQDTLDFKGNADSLAKVLITQYQSKVYLVAEISYQGKSLDWLEGTKLPPNILNYGMETYFTLTTKKTEELPLLHCHYSSVPGLSPSSKFVLTFSSNNKREELVFSMKEFGLGCGNLSIGITKNIAAKN